MSFPKANLRPAVSSASRKKRARFLVSLLLGLSAAAPRTFALIRFDEGRDQIFVTGSFSAGTSSNIGASAGGASDDFYTAEVGAQYLRRAGLISVDAALGLNATSYAKNSGENFRDPSLSVDFEKGTGRTTGGLKLSAARESRADTAANIRNESWSYEAALNVKYPMLNQTYAFLGGIGVTRRDFADNSSLANQNGFYSSLDFYYTMNERSLLAGYRYRQESTSFGTGSRDHSFTAGVSGPSVYGLNGTVRAGYQVRNPYGQTAGRKSYSGWTANGSTNWAVTKSLDFSGELSRDLSTTSTDVSVDTTGAAIQGQYRYNSRTSFSARTGLNRTRYLDASAANRRDTSWDWSLTASRSIFREHIKLSLSYAFYRNWSSFSFSTFDRRTLTFTASARY